MSKWKATGKDKAKDRKNERTSWWGWKRRLEKAGLKVTVQKTKIMASGPTTSWQIEGEKSDSNSRFCFLVFQNHCGQWLQPWNEKTLARQHIKKQKHYFANKGPYGLSSSHTEIWELDHKEGWAPKNWCFWIVVLEKPLESYLDSKEIKAVNPKGNQPWIFIWRTDDEA